MIACSTSGGPAGAGGSRRWDGDGRIAATAKSGGLVPDEPAAAATTGERQPNELAGAAAASAHGAAALEDARRAGGDAASAPAAASANAAAAPQDAPLGATAPGGPQRRIVRSPLRVRFAETDAQGVVYYGNYFVYFEVGRVDLLREARGTPRREAPEAEPGGGIHALMVVHAECDYRASARFDDLLEVQTWIEAMGRTSITFGHRVVRQPDGEELARGRVVTVHVGQDGRPEPVPAEWRAVLERYLLPGAPLTAPGAGSRGSGSPPPGSPERLRR